MDETAIWGIVGVIVGLAGGLGIAHWTAREDNRKHGELRRAFAMLVRVILCAPGIEPEMERRGMSIVCDPDGTPRAINTTARIEPATLHLVPGEVQAFGENRPPESQEP